jgi:hypothetical protein
MAIDMADASPASRPRPTRKPKRTISPEGRARLSQIAKERHARGEFGGAQFGKLGGRGKTREKRLAQQKIAEAAGVAHEDILQVFKDAIDPERPMGQRLKGATEWLAIERENAKLALQEEKADSQQMGREQLIAALRENLTGGPAATMIRSQLAQHVGEEIVDATVIE